VLCVVFSQTVTGRIAAAPSQSPANPAAAATATGNQSPAGLATRALVGLAGQTGSALNSLSGTSSGLAQALQKASATNPALRELSSALNLNTATRAGAASAQSTTTAPSVLANPISVSRIQSAYTAADAITGTLVVTFTVTNNLTAVLTPTIPLSATQPVSLDLSQDPHTIHNVILTDALTAEGVYETAAPAPDQQGSQSVWNLGDIQPLQSVTATITLQVPPSSSGFTTLDTGATAYGTLDGRTVTAQADPASLAPDTIDGAPSGNWLEWTEDADTRDQYMLAQAAELGQDPTREFDYVRSLGYESYQGSLRGTRGTLWSAAGNSLDKASLLIAMLRASGIPSRYRHGALNKSLAQQLILSMFPATTQLTGHIPAGTQLADPANDPTLLGETTDHWWVEAYLPGQGWQDLDPSFANATIGQSFVTAGDVATDGTDRIAEVPDVLRSKVTMTVKVETQSFFTQSFSHSYPLTHTFDSVQLSGNPVTLEHLVNTSTLGGLIGYAVQSTYTPYFVYDGQVIQGDPFQEVLTNFVLASIAVSAEWLDFDVQSPDGTTQHYEKTVFDHIGYANRQGGNNINPALGEGTAPAISPLDTVTTLFGPGQVSDVAVSLQQTRALDSGQQAQQALSAFDSLDPGSVEGTKAAQVLTNNTRSLLEADEPYQAMLFYNTYDSVAAIAGAQLRTHVYPDSPRIVVVASQISDSTSTDQSIALSIDLVHSPVRSIVSPTESKITSLAANMMTGLLAAGVENAVGAAFSPAGTQVSAINVFQAAQKTGIRIVAINKETEGVVPTLRLSSEAKARILVAVERGDLVFTPAAMVNIGDITTVAWYEVNPDTGAVVDTLDDGSHDFLGEAFIQLQALTIADRIVLVRLFTIELLLYTLKIQVEHSDLPELVKTSLDYLLDIAIVIVGAYIGIAIPGFQLNVVIQAVAITFYYLVGYHYNSGPNDPPVPDILLSSEVPRSQQAMPGATAALSAAGNGNRTGAGFGTITNLINLSGAYVQSSSAGDQHAVPFQTLTAPNASVYDTNGTLLGTGASATSDGSSPALVQGNVTAAVSGSGSASYYAPALPSLAAGGTWNSYAAHITATTPYTIGITGVPVTSTTVLTGNLNLRVPDYADFTGTGMALAPNFASTTTITGTNLDLQFGPATVTSGSLPFDASNGFALTGYSGPLTITHLSNGSDQVTLGASADYFDVHAVPASSTTDPTTPVNFQAHIDATNTDIYTTTVDAPDGWNATLDSSGTVTVTPAPDAQPGAYTILVTAQSGAHPDLFASATYTVTITAHQGLQMTLNPDPLTTVPWGPADPNAVPGDTNNGQVQLPGAAYTIDITNTSTVAHPIAVHASGLPAGWTILSGAGDGATSTTLDLPPGGVGQLGLYVQPTTATLPPAGTQENISVTATATDMPSLNQQASQTFTVPAIAFDEVTTNPQTVYSTPGGSTSFDLGVRNVGNASGTFPLGITVPISSWTATAPQPVALTAGQVVTNTITLQTPDGVLGQDYPVTVQSQTGAYTQTATVDVQVVSPQTQQIDNVAQVATTLFPSDPTLGASLQYLGTSIEALQESCQSAVTLVPTGQGACSVDLRDHVVAAIQGVIGATAPYAPQITVATELAPIAQTLAGLTTVSAIDTGLTTVQSSLSTLQPLLTELAHHGARVWFDPGRQVTLPTNPASYTLHVANTGDITTTYAITLTASSNKVTLSPTILTRTLAPGEDGAIPVTASAAITGTYTLAAQVAAAQGGSLPPVQAQAGLSSLNAFLQVTSVNANPNFVEYGSGTAPVVTVGIANVADRPITGTVHLALIDSTGMTVTTTAQPITITETLAPQVYPLGTIDTTGLVTGTYALSVTVVDASGNVIPSAAGQTVLGIGQAVHATSSVSPGLVAPGDALVTTTITVDGARLSLNPSTVGPNLIGTTQVITATLQNIAGTPISGANLTFTVSGPNPHTFDTITDSDGQATLSYVGANDGTDVVEAQVQDLGRTLSSAPAYVNWVAPSEQISTTSITGSFFTSDGAGSVDAAPPQQPVFTETFPTIDFNPPAGTIPGNTSGVDVNTRPMADVTTDINGNFTGTIVAQGNGYQAGVGPLFAFNAVFTSTFVISTPGDVTFDFYSDDGFFLGVGGDASYVSGTYVNPPASGLTPFEDLPVVASYNVPSSPAGNTVTIHFPKPGIYPYELDYSECCGGQLSMTMTGSTVGSHGIPPTGSVVLGPATSPTLTVGQTQTFAVTVTDGAGAPLTNIPVTLVVDGANARQLQANTNNAGVATFNYVGSVIGADTVQAVAPIGAQSSYSNSVAVQWASSNPMVPTVETGLLSNPLDGSTIAGQVPIALAPNLLLQNVVLAYAPANDPGATTILTTTMQTGGGVTLTTLDTTKLANGTYVLSLQGIDNNMGGRSFVTSILVTVANGTGPTDSLEVEHTIPNSGVTLDADTVSPPPDSIATDATGTHVQWQHLNGSSLDALASLRTSLPAMQPGEARQVASGTLISYSTGLTHGQVVLGPLYVTAAHLITLSPPNLTTSPGGQTVYQVTLNNPTQSPLTLQLSTSGLPDGWTAPIAPVTIAAGTQTTVPLTVTAPLDPGAANELGAHTFAVLAQTDSGGVDQAQATLTVGDPLNVQIDPVLAQIATSSAITYTVGITDTSSTGQTYALTVEGLPANLVSLPPSVSLAAGQGTSVPLVITADLTDGPYAFTVRATPQGAATSAATSAVLTVLGTRSVASALTPAVGIGGPTVPVSFTLTLTNTGSVTDTYGLSVHLPSGWSARLEANGTTMSSLSLTPYLFNSANLTLLVTPPAGAAPGDYPISVVSQSQSDPTVQSVATAAYRVTAQGVQVAISPYQKTLNPTDTGTWQVTVTNTGTQADSYSLAASGIISPTASFSPATVSLAPGQQQTVQLSGGPVPYALVQPYNFDVTATSQTNPAIQDSASANVNFNGEEGVAVAVQPATQSITNTLQTAYTLLITNTGNVDTHFTLRPTSNPNGIDLTPEVGDLEIPAHMTAGILLTALGHAAGDYTVSVKATADDGGASSSGSADLNIAQSALPPTVTPTATNTPTLPPAHTSPPINSPVPTDTPLPLATATVVPVATSTPIPVEETSTGTATALPASTSLPVGHPVFNGPTTLYFAEGYTGTAAANGKATFRETLNILNPDARAASVTITYYIQGESKPVVVQRAVPATSVWREDVNTDVGADKIVATVVTSSQGIFATRTISRVAANGTRLDDSTTSAATTPATRWDFAEGYTGITFQEYLVVLNTSTITSTVTVHLAPEAASSSEPREFSFKVPPLSRATVNIRALNAGDSAQSVGMIVDSSQPIVAERVEYFGNGSGSGKYGAIVSSGLPAPAQDLQIGYGSAGGAAPDAQGTPRPLGDQQYVTLLNPAASGPAAQVTAHFQDASGVALGQPVSIDVPPGTRRTIIANLALGKKAIGPFSVSLHAKDAPIQAEAAQYFGGSPNLGQHPGIGLPALTQGAPAMVLTDLSTRLADGAAVARTVYLYNPTTSLVSVEGVYLDGNGDLTTAGYTIAPGGITAIDINSALPASFQAGSLGAEFLATSSGGFLAYALGHTTGGSGAIEEVGTAIP
jgi:uncharacterized membrane protein